MSTALHAHIKIKEYNGAKLGGPALSYLGCSAFQMKGRFKGYDVSRTIGISQDGMFLGRPEFHRMGRFRGWGVSEDAAFLSRDWHFTVDAAKHRMGSFQEWPSFRGYGVSQSIDISRSICKPKGAAKHRMGPFIFR